MYEIKVQLRRYLEKHRDDIHVPVSRWFSIIKFSLFFSYRPCQIKRNFLKTFVLKTFHTSLCGVQFDK